MRLGWSRFRGRIGAVCQVVYRGVREWCGDAAYETYAASVLRKGGKSPLTPTEFYVEQLDRKYSRPNRCC
jgi:uncharacterized short protein YbdD (DUF466 family)